MVVVPFISFIIILGLSTNIAAPTIFPERLSLAVDPIDAGFSSAAAHGHATTLDPPPLPPPDALLPNTPNARLSASPSRPAAAAATDGT